MHYSRAMGGVTVPPGMLTMKDIQEKEFPMSKGFPVPRLGGYSQSSSVFSQDNVGLCVIWGWGRIDRMLCL